MNDVLFQFLSIVSGIVCGICGYTDLYGFLFFLVFNVFIGGAVVAKLNFKPKQYFVSVDQIIVNGASNSVGTFVLFWTLFYNICHLF